MCLAVAPLFAGLMLTTSPMNVPVLNCCLKRKPTSYWIGFGGARGARLVAMRFLQFLTFTELSTLAVSVGAGGEGGATGGDVCAESSGFWALGFLLRTRPFLATLW